MHFGNPTKWTSKMLQCFTSGSSIKSYESTCQQLQEVDSCCRRKEQHFNYNKTGDHLEVRSILVDAISVARNKFCNRDEAVSVTVFTPPPWQCNAELTTIFEQCLNHFAVPLKVPLEEFSFVECHSIYSMKDCTIQQILNCRSALLLDVFSGFLRKLTSRTLCDQQENVNDM
ncbi:uncharacterized protein LOC135702738 [Ochlerotatus camptorhynchus]|uniref:uncharacterized protein LOC135702738 n=1 Tax=Ochlerotatus camptorhynchus TaxID=644619 RepID=UPI0031D99D84